MTPQSKYTKVSVNGTNVPIAAMREAAEKHSENPHEQIVYDLEFKKLASRSAILQLLDRLDSATELIREASYYSQEPWTFKFNQWLAAHSGREKENGR